MTSPTRPFSDIKWPTCECDKEPEGRITVNQTIVNIFIEQSQPAPPPSQRGSRSLSFLLPDSNFAMNISENKLKPEGSRTTHVALKELRQKSASPKKSPFINHPLHRSLSESCLLLKPTSQPVNSVESDKRPSFLEKCSKSFADLAKHVIPKKPATISGSVQAKPPLIASLTKEQVARNFLSYLSFSGSEFSQSFTLNGVNVKAPKKPWQSSEEIYEWLVEELGQELYVKAMAFELDRPLIFAIKKEYPSFDRIAPPLLLLRTLDRKPTTFDVITELNSFRVIHNKTFGILFRPEILNLNNNTKAQEIQEVPVGEVTFSWKILSNSAGTKYEGHLSLKTYDFDPKSPSELRELMRQALKLPQE